VRRSNRIDSGGKTVQSVEGGILVTLRERRVVENGVNKIVDFPAHREHRLPDMHQFDCAFPDDVHAQQLAALAMEQQLHEADTVTDDLPAGQLAIGRLAGFVRDILLGELLFGLADERDLGDRVDAIGKILGCMGRLVTEGMADG